ncbi:DUF2968 domain-containing protein [Paraburkholderia caffeinilytica]|uniref:DUF2968 domain-containing protein n=1 Tax=Paraburkholderia caffeinilytica TaxID=1761016 RepID=UPI003DA073E1
MKMKHTLARSTLRCAILLATLGVAGLAFSQTDQPAPTGVAIPDELKPISASSTVAASQSAVRSPVGGNVAALTKLVAAGKVAEIESSSAAEYRVQLFLQGDGATYYVALSQQNEYWLVMTTPNYARAQSQYHAFVRRMVQLAAAHLLRVNLEMQNAAARRRLAETQALVERLQADLEVAQTQRDESDALQDITAQRIMMLRKDEESEHAMLADSARKIRVLQRQLNAGLSPVTAKVTLKRKSHVRHPSATTRTATKASASLSWERLAK